MTETRSGVALDPYTASPVLKTQINITLEDDFPYEMFKEDFSVNATNISNPEYFRPMNVIAVYDELRILTAMFGGAWTGDYTIDIRHRAYGLVDTRGLTFIVGSNVTSISPQQGSKYGGTLVTITGNNFGTVPTDNPVQISTLGGVGSVDCYVQTINPEQITCRVDATEKDMDTEAKMITFLKTSEEALCVPNDTCTWTYKEPEAILESRELAFDAASQQWQLSIVGYGFSGTPELYIGG